MLKKSFSCFEMNRAYSKDSLHCTVNVYTNFNVTTWLQGVLSTGIGLHLDIEIVHSVSTSHRYGMNAERTVKIMAHTSKKSNFYFAEIPISRMGLERSPRKVGEITVGLLTNST